MPRANQTNQTTVTRERDYARLLDDASLMLDGMDARLVKAEAELRRLLGNHQNAVQIMQLISRPGDGYAASVGKRAILNAKVREYQRGVDRQRAETAQTVSDIPVNPDDASKDVDPDEPEPEHTASTNGKVAVAV